MRSSINKNAYLDIEKVINTPPHKRTFIEKGVYDSIFKKEILNTSEYYIFKCEFNTLPPTFSLSDPIFSNSSAFEKGDIIIARDCIPNIYEKFWYASALSKSNLINDVLIFVL